MSFPVQVPTDVLDRTPAEVVEVPMPYLALRAPWVWAFVALVIRSPHLREHLGTRRGQDRVRQWFGPLVRPSPALP